ncbi:MAG: MFS transporter [Chloroflexota bacterium]|nr:MFS transporter [Chloroflexota bacterium]MDE2884882.1 MFS transporter [Chloroflexota bacterium]
MNALGNLALLGAFIRNPRRYPTYLGYFNGFIYGFSMGAAILYPLYAIDQGFSLASQGFIVAAPGIVMIMLRLVGGAVSDRFGEKLILWFSFITVTIASVIPVFTATFLSLTVAQLFNGASRSVYWSAAQSYISRSAEGEAGKVMGRQLSFESAGGIIGAIVVGFVAEGVGYPHAFVLTATLTFIGFLITSSLPRLPRRDQVSSFAASLAPAKTMLVKRTLLHAHMVAFTSAAYSGLVMGLFIAFFHDVGYGEGGTAVIRSLNSIGVSVLAYFFGALLGFLGSRTTAMAGITLTGLLAVGIGATGAVPVVPAVFMALTGITFGSLRSLYPTLAAENSEPNQRAMALSVVGLYWAIGIFASPLVFGFIADATTIRTAIFVFGGFSIVAGSLSPLLYDYGRRGIVREAEQEEEAGSGA